MPKLQILLDKGKVTFNNNNNNNNNNKRKRFRVFNFPRAAILDFMTSLRCPIVSSKKNLSFPTAQYSVSEGNLGSCCSCCFLTMVVVVYKRIVVVVEYLEGVIFLHRLHPLQYSNNTFLSSFQYRGTLECSVFGCCFVLN